MSLTERNRAVLHQKFSALIDDEEAVGEMISNIATKDDLASKEFVRAEISGLRAELHAEINRMIMWTVGVNIALVALVLTLTGLR